VLGRNEGLAEACVEPLRDLSHQLDVLLLILTDGNLVGPVRKHVRGLQDRVEEEPRRDELLLLSRLLLELGHPSQLSVCRHARQQPAQLGVLMDVGLAEQDAAVGVEPGSEHDRGGVVHALAKLGRVVGHRDRVQVDDAVDGIAAVLPLDVLTDGPDVVAQVLPPGGLDPREDAHAQRVPRVPEAERQRWLSLGG
jgi:hypothetical protein